MTNKVQKIREKVERLIEQTKPYLGACAGQVVAEANNKIAAYNEVLALLDTMQEEPVSEDLEKAASRYAKEEYNYKIPATLPDRCRGCYAPLMYAFKADANWRNEQIIKRLCNHANINQMVEKFEDKYKPEKVLDTEYYKRGIFDTFKAIKEG